MALSRDFRWTPTLVAEQAATVTEIALASLRGEKVSALAWHRVKMVNEKARVRDRAPPGPATYDPFGDASPARRGARKARSTMGLPPASGFVQKSIGSNRIRVLPAAAPASELKEELTAQEQNRRRLAPGACDRQVLSNKANVASVTLRAKPPMDPVERERLRMNRMARLPPAAMPTSIGRQVLSTNPSAPSTNFKSGPTRAQLIEKDLREGVLRPSPTAYGIPSIEASTKYAGSRQVTIPGHAGKFSTDDVLSAPKVGAVDAGAKEAALVPGPGAYSPTHGLGAPLTGPSFGPRSRNVVEIPLSSTAAGSHLLARDIDARVRLSNYRIAHERRQPRTPRSKQDT